MAKAEHNSIIEAFNRVCREQVKAIVEEETKKAQEEVERRISNMLPDVTSYFLERTDYHVDEKQIIFKIRSGK